MLYLSEKNKMSSTDDQENLKEIKIDDLSCQKVIKSSLKTSNIKTLGDLTKFDKKEFKSCGFGEVRLKELSDELNALNVKFISELTKEEKKKIITNSDITKVLNSSIYWLDSASNVSMKDIALNRMKDIKDLFCFILKNNPKYQDEILIEAKELGMNLDALLFIASNINYIDFLNSSINVLRLEVKTFNALKRYGINTVQDLIDLKLSDLDNVPNLNSKMKNEIITKVHSKNLLFIDELEKYKGKNK